MEALKRDNQRLQRQKRTLQRDNQEYMRDKLATEREKEVLERELQRRKEVWRQAEESTWGITPAFRMKNKVNEGLGEI